MYPQITKIPHHVNLGENLLLQHGNLHNYVLTISHLFIPNWIGMTYDWITGHFLIRPY